MPQRTVIVMSTAVMEGVDEEEEQLVVVEEDFSPPPLLLAPLWREPVLLVELTTLMIKLHGNIRVVIA